MRLRMRALLLGVLAAGALSAGLLASGPARAGVTEDAFQVRSTGDLVTLCGADKTDPMYTPAQNFCHGFAVGTYTTLVDMQKGLRAKKKLFCPPASPPSRNDGIASFVAWARAHNDMMALPAVDGVLQFLGEQYPCK